MTDTTTNQVFGPTEPTKLQLMGIRFMGDSSEGATGDDKKDETPEWGDDFDAATAWKALKAARAEAKDLKGKIATERTKRQEADDAKAAAENALAAADTDGKLTTATARAAAAEKSLWKERALRKFPMLDGDEDLLDGDDEETILKRAERLSKIGTKKDDDKKDDDKSDDLLPSGGKPAENLKPGAVKGSGEPDSHFDAAAIAGAALANR